MNVAEAFYVARQAVEIQHRQTSIAQLLDKKRRLTRENQRLITALAGMRADRNAETQRADRAERQARDMRRELDAIRERMRDARREVGAS